MILLLHGRLKKSKFCCFDITNTLSLNQCTTGAAVVVGQVVSGLVFKRIGHVKWQLVGCCVGFTAFLGGMAAVNASNRGLAIAVSFPNSGYVL